MKTWPKSASILYQTSNCKLSKFLLAKRVYSLDWQVFQETQSLSDKIYFYY
jgi:hypothetical protein